jgi:hypothetical protein
MPLSLPVPDAAWSSQGITLGGKDYTFTFSYNTKDSRWRFDISLGGVVVIAGVKVMENQSLLSRYILEDFDHGDILCMRFKDDDLPVGRDNLGLGKPYELIYFTNEELS